LIKVRLDEKFSKRRQSENWKEIKTLGEKMGFGAGTEGVRGPRRRSEMRVEIQGLPEGKSNVNVLCFDLVYFSRPAQFIILSGGVFFFYLLYGYYQELIFSLPGFTGYGWYLTLIQFFYYTVFGKVEMWLRGEERKVPLRTYTLLAITTVGTMGFSNASLEYLNYPTQVIFKCCKLIPVLLGGILIQGKRYGPLDFLAAGLMCLGLILFLLADIEVSPNFNFTGVVMIGLALVADAVIGNVQEKTIKQYNASNSEVVLYSYAVGFVYLFFLVAVFTDIASAINYCNYYPKHTYGYAFIFSLTGYLGIQIVLGLVRQFGAFLAVTVTTFRKAISIVLSFIFFSKPFTINYIYSGVIVLAGIYLSMYAKDKENRLVLLCKRFLFRLQKLVWAPRMKMEKSLLNV